VSSAKYKVGQLVDFCGNKAIVKSVQEHFYFYGADTPYYEYEVEMTNGGAVHKVMESALKEVVAKQQNLCHCGAWAIHWANEHHADYCPLHDPFKEKL
jgi:hypothetical protein